MLAMPQTHPELGDHHPQHFCIPLVRCVHTPVKTAGFLPLKSPVHNWRREGKMSSTLYPWDLTHTNLHIYCTLYTHISRVIHPSSWYFLAGRMVRCFFSSSTCPPNNIGQELLAHTFVKDIPVHRQAFISYMYH